MNANTTTDTPFPRFAALHNLPVGYRVVYRLSLDNFRAVVALNIAGLVLMLIGFFGFAWVGSKLSASGADPLAGQNLLFTVLLLGGYIVMIVFHELCHGFAFMLFGARPTFGVNLRKSVAFASAADYYITRDAYFIVALTPLATISLLCTVFIALTGGETRLLWIIIGAANVAGAVGDLWFVLICRRHPRSLLVRDYGEGAELYSNDPNLPEIPTGNVSLGDSSDS